MEFGTVTQTDPMDRIKKGYTKDGMEGWTQFNYFLVKYFLCVSFSTFCLYVSTYTVNKDVYKRRK